MKELWSKHSRIIMATLCLIFVIVFAFFLALDTYEGREISYDYSVEIKGEAVLAVGYENKNGKLVPKNEGAYLVLPVTDEKINDVRIVFKSPFVKPCDIKLVFATENSGLSVDNSVTVTVGDGYYEYYCTLPYDTYTILECYIPAEIEIESVILSNVLSSSPVKVRKLDNYIFFSMSGGALFAYLMMEIMPIVSRRIRNRKQDK